MGRCIDSSVFRGGGAKTEEVRIIDGLMYVWKRRWGRTEG